MKNFKFSSLIVVAGLLASNVGAFASTKYYIYTVKAREADIPVINRVGDHAYICIKKTKKKHGKYKTIRKYGCYNYYGGTSGGHTKGRHWIVKKTSHTERMKDGAICAGTYKCSFIHYGVGGVCHQSANRILIGAKWYAGIPFSVRGYMATYAIFGKYGDGTTLARCYYNCYK